MNFVDEEDSYRIIGGCYPGCGPFEVQCLKHIGDCMSKDIEIAIN